MNNQKGYAFLLVLGTIVIIGLLVPPLAYQILSSSTQASQTEQRVQLDNMYDMGRELAWAHVEAALEGGEIGYAVYAPFEGSTWDDAQAHFNSELLQNSTLMDQNTLLIEDLLFDTYSADVEITFKDITLRQDPERLGVRYEVTPVVDDERYPTEEETFFLRDSGEGTAYEPDWFTSDENGDRIDDALFEGGRETKNNPNFNQNETIPPNTIFEQEVQLSGNNRYTVDGNIGLEGGLINPGSEGGFDINGHLYLLNSTITMMQNSYIIVNGNGYFHGSESEPTTLKFNHENRDEPFICIAGSNGDNGDVFRSGTIEFENTAGDVNDFIPIDSCSDLEDKERPLRNVYYTGELFDGGNGSGDGNGQIRDGIVPQGTRSD